ncbi:conserved hypothetical protein [Lodderomyces elongisporus NRRL YB-4239]|uniref:General negative regulator of transcription subunit 1 n=1 Tax=Lodderomyces elongisporus (strain ATCC 11503 / CBS 2605 / JCM 1781 / NBRC 1676 / NRRL YB-4239) TaxID=379508 RepID=A5E5S7_LODEL|nr:conserved hypothetical protein [Lodderomyces elongisporus NRRL YB-4239]
MSFKELITEVGFDDLVPEKLLPSLLQIKPNEVDEGIALVLAEILIPGSQGINKNAHLQQQTLPEANAKGAQLQASFRAIEAQLGTNKLSINWYEVFNHMQQNLFEAGRRYKLPTAVSLTQFLSSLDFKQEPLDIFFNNDWYFDKTLLYLLQTADPAQGAYDISLLNNLALCFEEDKATPPQPGRRNILRFINIGKFELKALSGAQAQQVTKHLNEKEVKLNTFINQQFDHDYRVFPEYVLAAAVSMIERTPFINDLVDTLFGLLMDSDSPTLPKVMRVMLETGLAIPQLVSYYNSRKSVVAAQKVANVASRIGIINEVIAQFWTTDINSAVSVLVESSFYGVDIKGELDTKLKDQQFKKPLYIALLDVLNERAQKDYEAFQQHQQREQNPQSASGGIPPSLSRQLPFLKISTVNTLVEKLKNSSGLIDLKKWKNLQILILTTYPRLINFGSGHDEVILANEAKSTFFPQEVELEMKEYYSKMYSKAVEIPEVVDALIKMKSSDDPHQQDVFACMIHSLLDEYKFFSEYPLAALASTSLLFGALLENDLIHGTTLTVALNFIFESCNQPPESKLFKFAVQSLYNFKSKLHEYPIYCKHLLECQSLATHAKMYQVVKDAANGIPCGGANSATGATQTPTPDVGPKYQSINYVEQAVGSVQQEEPSEEIKDKLLFAVNNMTMENMRLTEIKSHLQEAYYAWFADYLVGDRARAEPNNHKLYSDLVESLADPIFTEYVMNVTMKEVFTIIRNFKDSRSERNQLKNLGAWLGRITLAIDKPLRRDLIALKFLLVEAYDFKSLPLIIPFVCKILDQAQFSRVFKPPNPWILGIMSVLAELYEHADLKLQLKFEVEVLLNSFEMKVTDLEQSTIIRNHSSDATALAQMFGLLPQVGQAQLTSELSRLNLDAGSGSSDLPSSNVPLFPPQAGIKKQLQQFQQPPLSLQQQQAQAQAQAQVPANSIHAPQPQQVQPQTQQESGWDTSFSQLVGNSVFTQHANLRRAFQASLSRAVRECAIPIMNRVSEAVLVTTEYLIKKDFATEVDVDKFRQSYRRLAQQLAHSMVLCSGKKILAETIEATMLQLLGNNPNDIPMLELSNAVQANVGLCVDIVDKIATNNITDLIDERMRPYILNRERHKFGQPYIENGTPESSLRLPEPLGLSTRGLSAQQLKIYEHFGEFSGVERSNAPTPLIAQPQPHQPLVQQLPQQLPQHLPQHLQQQQLHTLHTNSTQHTYQQQQQQVLQQQQPHQLQQITQDFPAHQQQSRMLQEDVASVEQLFAIITQYCEKAINLLADVTETKIADLPPNHPIMTALTQALSIAQANAIKFPDLLLKAAQYAVNCLFTQAHENSIANEIYVIMLDKLCEFSPSTAKDVTWWLVNSSDQRKFNMPVILSLLKVQLIQPTKLDSSIGALIKESNNPVVVKFGATLLYSIFTAEDLARPIALRSEFAHTLDALYEYQRLQFNDNDEENKQAKAEVDKLFEVLGKADPVSKELFAQLGYVFAEWVRLLSHGNEQLKKDASEEDFIAGLVESGILTNPVHFKSFWKAAIEISVALFGTEHELRSRTQHEAYLSVDCLAILVVRVVMNVENEAHAISYLKNIIGVVLFNLISEHEEAKAAWNERAYFRFFSSLLSAWNDVSVLDNDATKSLDSQFFQFIGECFNSLQPIVLPGFTFAWISLISHRMFLPRLMELPDGEGYAVGVKLLLALFKFQDTYQLKENSHDVSNVTFKAINRIFVGLLHEYPDFLVECHYQLIAAAPRGYIQLKNIILSASPKSMTIPDPFTPGLKVERLPEINDAPKVFYKPMDDLIRAGLKKPVETFLRIPSSSLVRAIYNGLKLAQPKQSDMFGIPETVNFNHKLVNALVLHVGMNAVAEKSPAGRNSFNSKSSQVALLVDLMNYGSNEFKYLLISSIANQLRYPNSHTHWFIGIILHFFLSNTLWNTSGSKLAVQEIITRVLLERRIVNKPHPWGLTIVFLELVKNDDFGFFDLPFVKNSIDEVKTIFDTLADNVKGSN